jgi:hypothetical protein
MRKAYKRKKIKLSYKKWLEKWDREGYPFTFNVESKSQVLLNAGRVTLIILLNILIWL